jgi:hypothetical protein
MKPVKPQFAIMLCIAVFMLQACYCTSAIPNVVCMKEDGTTYIYGMDDLWGYDECGQNGDTQVGVTYDNPTPAPLVLPNNSTNNIVAPTGLNCNFLQLTAPLSGLPNGTATFYWNPLPNATSYRIKIYDNNSNLLATFDSQGTATNLSADVSWAAIGGQYDLQVELVAFGANGASCRETVTIPREAPSGGVPNNGGGGNGGGNGGSPAPSATPTCAEDPSQSWCIR